MPTRLGPMTVRYGPRTSGHATILVHGAAGTWTTWTPLIEAARRAGRRSPNVLLVELPGWGDTPLPDRPLRNGKDSRTIDAYARAVADAARALGHREWTVTGHSLGGVIALHLAAIEPVATRAVGLVSATTFAVMDAAAHPVRRFVSLPAYVGLLVVMRVFAPLGDTASRLLGWLDRRGMLPAIVSPLFAQPSRIPVSVTRALAAEVRPRTFVMASDEAARYPAAELWAHIRCPVRSVHGEHDAFVAASDDERLAELIADYSVTVLPGSGHFAQIEEPALTLQALSDVAEVNGYFSPRS